jgi:steroid 5-alpha reductase family enzyme
LGFLFSGFDALHEWNPFGVGDHEAFREDGLRGRFRRRLSRLEKNAKTPPQARRLLRALSSQRGLEERLALQIDRRGARPILGAKKGPHRTAAASLILMNAWTLVGFGTNAALIIMAVAWAITRRVKNASYLEVAWSYGFAVVGWIYALIGPAEPLRKWVITGMVTIWSLRLGTSLLFEVGRHHPAESHRYAALREQFPKRPWLMFFGFSQYQAALIGLLSAPFAIACSNAAPGMSGWEVAGLILWFLAITGQTVANFQSSRFRSDQRNSGKVCDAGLWRYSRHPDCFFEWLIWVAYFIFTLGSPWGWVTVYCPFLMLYFLTQVTGIPPAEALCLKTLGDGYRHYQRTTNAFFPGSPKPGNQSSGTRINEVGDA